MSENGEKPGCCDRSGRCRSATFRFYAELNDFLHRSRRGQGFEYRFEGRPGIRDAVEAMGVPHTEIDLIVVNGESVGFEYRLEDGDRVSVYPVFESFDISPVVRLRPEPLREPKFVLDVHLGKLARLLRLLGFDCSYERYAEDPEIIDCSLTERRTILTRDIGLLKCGRVTHGYWVRSCAPPAQLAEVVDRFQLRGRARAFTRCSVCNGTIKPADTERALQEAPEKVRAWCREYYRCCRCGRLYWKGTHYESLCKLIEPFTV